MDAVIAVRMADLDARMRGLDLVELSPRLRVIAASDQVSFSIPDNERMYVLTAEPGVAIQSDLGAYNPQTGGEQAFVHEGRVTLRNESGQIAQVEFLVATFGHLVK